MAPTNKLMMHPLPHVVTLFLGRGSTLLADFSYRTIKYCLVQLPGYVLEPQNHSSYNWKFVLLDQHLPQPLALGNHQASFLEKINSTKKFTNI